MSPLREGAIAREVRRDEENLPPFAAEIENPGTLLGRETGEPGCDELTLRRGGIAIKMDEQRDVGPAAARAVRNAVPNGEGFEGH
jgi:hypothetical protein